MKTAADRLEENGYENVITFTGPSFDDALIGVTTDNRAVYDYGKMVLWLMNHEEMSREEAVDWLEYNTVGALSSAGPDAPVILQAFDE